METPIVIFWVFAAKCLQLVSPFELLKRVAKSRWFAGPVNGLRANGAALEPVDLWVILNGIASVVALSCAIHLSSSSPVLVIFKWYAIVRITEMVAYQLRVNFVDPYEGSEHTVRSFRRITLLVLHNYLEFIVWFASLYVIWRNEFSSPAVLTTWIGAIYCSVGTMTTLGAGNLVPATDKARLLVTTHVGVAIFWTLLIISHFVGFLPRPRSLDEREHNTV